MRDLCCFPLLRVLRSRLGSGVVWLAFGPFPHMGGVFGPASWRPLLGHGTVLCSSFSAQLWSSPQKGNACGHVPQRCPVGFRSGSPHGACVRPGSLAYPQEGNACGPVPSRCPVSFRCGSPHGHKLPNAIKKFCTTVHTLGGSPTSHVKILLDEIQGSA